MDEFITYFVKGITFLVGSYWGALFFILFGLYFIKKALKEREITSNHLRGWAAGVSSVIVAFLILYLKLTGQT